MMVENIKSTPRFYKHIQPYNNHKAQFMNNPIPPQPQIAQFGAQKLLIVKIRTATIAQAGSLYEAARRFWAVSPGRAANRPVLAVTLEDNVIQEVYDVEEWHVKENRKTKTGMLKPFYEFTGTPMSGNPWADALIGKRIPASFIGGQNCVRYVN